MGGDDASVREGGGRAWLRRHRPGLSRKHWLQARRTTARSTTGAKEVDDVYGAYDYLKTLPHVDAERVGVVGWSHGGFITAHLCSAATRRSRPAPHRPGDQSRLPFGLKGRATSATSPRSPGCAGSRTRSRRSTSSARRCIRSRSCSAPSSYMWPPTTRT
ncbi:MAG: prolyl oligopeptidase family serine peptidase [Gemmatimonadetes bacterium]|nr:prolyl oligopeptidase family serine peptidase [Gemmatimonadota bacterium]